MPGALRIVQVNLAYDEAITDPHALLDRYHTLTGWSRAVKKAGARVSVVQRFATGATIARDGIDYDFRSDGGPPVPEPSGWSPEIADAVRSQRPDVVHVNGLMFPAMVGALGAALPEAAIVVQDHAGVTAPGFWERVRGSSWRGLTAADAWSFTAAEHADPWREAGLLDDARVLEIVEASTSITPVGRHVSKAQTGIAGDPVVLWVGRLNANKDPVTVLRGLEIAFARMPEARCCMVYSDAALEADVRAQIERSPSLRNRVTLAGLVAHDRLPWYFGGADFYVSGSHREGSGYALIEAMACGVIPIVTNIPSFRAIIGDCGMRWQPGDAGSLAEVFVKAARFDRAAECARVRERFVLDLSWDAIGRRTLDAYRSLVDDRRRGPQFL